MATHEYLMGFFPIVSVWLGKPRLSEAAPSAYFAHQIFHSLGMR